MMAARILPGLVLCGLSGVLGGCAESKAAAEGGARATQTSGACGDKGLPDCPLQSWMKANLQSQLNTGDMTRLARALDDLSTHAPAGFDKWSASATKAADAARRHDVAGVKAECKACHDRDRNRFRAELRKTSLF
ncbi:MAG TPA: hypothetical protein VG937_30435 [Polyangiaceae bacterium]|nr:hypothetical protein [Polyangiaceae bacterium]